MENSGTKINLLVFSPYYPPHRGGLESHAEQFNLNLAKHYGYDITVVTFNLPASQEKETIIIGDSTIQIFRVPALEIIGNYPLPNLFSASFWKVLNKLRKTSFSIVISRTRFFSSSLLAGIFAKTSKTPWVHIEHGSDHVHLDNPITNFFAYFYDITFGKVVLAFADQVVANSKASADFARTLCDRNYSIIYRGIQKEIIEKVLPSFSSREKFQGKKVITYLGRLIDGKGIADLIKSIKLLNKQNIICWIIGDGPNRNQLEKIVADLHLTKQVVFWGSLKNDEAISLIKVSDIFVNPSYTEGLPTSVIEAAFCSKAIIATDVGGTKEIVVDPKGITYFKAGDVEALVSKINDLLNNDVVREEVGKRALESVSHRFNWRDSLEQYNSLFLKILAKNKYTVKV